MLSQCSKSTSLDSFVYDFFFQKSYFKKYFILLSLTLVQTKIEVPDHLLLEREVCSVISSVEIEVSKYELATNVATWDSDSDLDMDNIICDKGNHF